MTHPKDFGGYPDRMNPPKDNRPLMVLIAMMGLSLVLAYFLIVISTLLVVK